MMKYVVLVLLIFGSSNLSAQRVLTLDDCISLAKLQGPGAFIAEKSYYSAYWDYEAFRASLFPQISLSANLPGLNRSINRFVLPETGDYLFREQSNAFSSANLNIAQVIPWTGGSFSVSSSLSRNDELGENISLNPESTLWRSTPLLIRFEQPIFRYNFIKWQRKSEDLQYKIAQRKRVEDAEGVTIDITQKFFALYRAEKEVENASFNVSINDTIFTISKGRYNVGTIAENELLQIELELLRAKTDLSRAKLNYQRALKSLKTALSLPESELILISPPTEFSPVVFQPEEAVHQAMENSSSLLSSASQELSAEQSLAQAKADARLSANLTASFGFNQSGEQLADAYESPLDQQFFTVSFQVPLFQWGQAKAKVESAKAAKERAETSRQQQEREFAESVQALAEEFLLIQNQVALAAKADTIAIRRFDVSKNRYLVGKIDITDLFNAQQEKDRARQNYIQTLGDYWDMYFRLRQQTLFDFRQRETLILD